MPSTKHSPDTNPSRRVALVHDWLIAMRGGEYVLEAIAELFPGAELFTMLHIDGGVKAEIERLPIHTSWLQYLPAAKERYRHYLPLMPALTRTLDVSDFDLVISSSHCVAKGVRKGKHAVHVSYVHAPMRYMWDRFDDYFGKGRAPLPIRAAAQVCRPFLQGWDSRVSQPDRIDKLIANSAFIANQIERAYGRTADVVYPFVDLSRFSAPRAPEDYYLMVGAFAPNKRVDLAIETFNRLGLRLKIIGKGQEEARLRAMAGSTIEFLGGLSNQEIAEHFSHAKGFIFPGLEDFGITPLEAMASGCPVIAYGAGGAAETVVDGVSGLLFREQTTEALTNAVLSVERDQVVFDEKAVRARAAEFSREKFQERFMQAVAQATLR